MTDPLRRRLVLALAAGGLVLGGCASTPAAPREGRHYTETISSVLASQNHQHIVAIGRRHHYVFDVPPMLARALQSPAHTQLTAEFSPFHVDARGDIAGEVGLRLPAGASPEAQRAAAEIGLVHQADDSWQASTRLVGHRYSSWTYRGPNQTQEKLGRPYTIDVTTDENLAEAAAGAADTPVRVAADGVQLIYYAALAPIIIPVIFLTRARDH
ncbi:MAG TPA: hypothetical protein VJ743_07200 [Albitalea sp.]|nr:hypothetical protein [Albitalea sp.]